MRKILFILLLLLLVIPMAQGQYTRKEMKQWWRFHRQRHSNVSVTLAGGLDELMADSRPWNPSLPGGCARIEGQYTYLWDRQWGISAGLGLTYGHSTYRLQEFNNSFVGSVALFDADGEYMRTTHYSYAVDGICEGYHAFFLSLPVQMAFQKWHLHAHAGFRLLLPLSVNARYTYGSSVLGLGCLIDGTDTRLHNTVEVAQLGQQDGAYKLSSLVGGAARLTTVAAAFDIGYRYALDDYRMIILSFYADIGLNYASIGGGSMVDFSGDIPIIHHVMESDAVSTLRYFDIGISLAYSFTYGERFRYVNPFKSPKSKRRRYRF